MLRSKMEEMRPEILNVVNEHGDVVGQASRQEIHEKGLLHAEVHVWFYTPRGQLIFQHRAKDKDTWPDLLDATVGGHVEIGDTYEQTALKEAWEETGVKIDPAELVFLCTTITRNEDAVTGMINHPRRNVYAYCYRGRIEDLRVEEGKALGFEVWDITRLLNLSQEDSHKFIPSIFDQQGMEIIRAIENLV